ncbi:hypothetical protein C8F04DRAFT_1253507 [Mycena alexandri]|uniref:F-box domain-containing protein n=1 Tax=Mycena alexandri TaxID=1745969 RepID=A0AAD6XD86_9AGAR|nr:hypothetical protein C8F04DRAFT_1253507 [Mycena alexandri]
MADILLTAVSLFSLLPLELCLLIFDIVLAPGRDQLRLRHKVCRCSSQWYRFLLEHPRYWDRILVESAIPREWILRYIALARALPLRFHISLNSSDPIVNLSYLAPHLAGATHFTVESDSDETVHRLYLTFKGLVGPNLRFFALFFRPPPSRMGLVDYTPLMPRPWFGDATFSGGSTQCLEILHLCCAVVPFSRLFFPRLRVLRLWGVHPGYSLDLRSIRDVIVNSPCLTEVTFRRFSCTGLASDDLPAIMSASIQVLELGFSTDGSLAQLIALFEFPSLFDLTVEVGSDRHVEQLIAIPSSLLVGVTKLLIRNPLRYARSFIFRADLVFPLFPILTHLDIRNSRSAVFRSMVQDCVAFWDANGSNLIPRLHRLFMNQAPVADIARFAALYCCTSPSAVPLSLHTLHAGLWEQRIFDVPTEADFAHRRWLQNNVADFRLEYLGCPPY